MNSNISSRRAMPSVGTAISLTLLGTLAAAKKRPRMPTTVPPNSVATRRMRAEIESFLAMLCSTQFFVEPMLCSRLNTRAAR